MSMTQSEIIEQIDWERRETNSKFIAPIQTKNLMNRGVRRVLREPGIRTVQQAQTINLTSGTGRYALNSDFKELINLVSGSGEIGSVSFSYSMPDEFDQIITGYTYTFKKKGFIDIKVTDVNNLPQSSAVLNYWSKNIILDADGVTEKSVWENDEDTSLLDDEFDEFYIMWPVARILKREGKKEWTDYLTQANECIALQKEQLGAKNRRPRRSFGNYLTQ